MQPTPLDSHLNSTNMTMKLNLESCHMTQIDSKTPQKVPLVYLKITFFNKIVYQKSFFDNAIENNFSFDAILIFFLHILIFINIYKNDENL